jgi:hypothetical protein
MRKCDRQEHGEQYPTLSYPELYILDGGYKAFFEKYSRLCTPRCYLPMLHRDYQQMARRCRAQCNRDSKMLKQAKAASVHVRKSLHRENGIVVRTALRF